MLATSALLLVLWSTAVLAGWLPKDADYERSRARLARRGSLRAMREARGRNRKRAGASAVAPLPGEIVNSRYLGCPDNSNGPLSAIAVFGSSGAGKFYLTCYYTSTTCYYDSTGANLPVNQGFGNNPLCDAASRSTSVAPSSADTLQYTACASTDTAGNPLNLANSQVISEDGDNSLSCSYSTNNGQATCNYDPTNGGYTGGSTPPRGQTSSCPPVAFKASSSDGYVAPVV